MPRTPEQNEALRVTTQEAIQAAAVRVFARHGFAATNMRQVAAEAGLSTGSIYRHYSGKEQLFQHLLTQASAGLAAASERLRKNGAPLALVRDLTTTFLADVAGDRGALEFFLVINHGFLTDTPAGTARRLAAAHRSFRQAFADLVRRGQERGDFAPGDPTQITAYYFATLSGVATTRQVMGDNGFGESGVALVLRLLTGGREP